MAWKEAYEAWKKTPDKTALHNVVQSLEPAIKWHLSKMGASNDPLMHTKAKLYAADAVQSWDSTANTSLPTWVSHQMSRLYRFRRVSNQVLNVPERVQLDASSIARGTAEFQDKNNREPDEDELADATGLTKKRIADVRKSMLSMPGEGALADYSPAISATDHTREAMDAAYDDSDSIDRAIMEHRMGYNNRPVLPTPELLAKTKLSAPQLARRAGRLAVRIGNITSDLEKLYS